MTRLPPPPEPHPPGAAKTSSAHRDPGSESRIEALETELRTLRRREAHTGLILDSATEYAIITLDPDGCITSWNDGAETILGYAEAEVTGRSGEIIFTAADRESGRFGLELRLAAETGRAANERWHLRRNGTCFWASGLMMPLKAIDGQKQGFLSIFRDGTDVRATTERHALLMGEMDHRLRNTLAMVHVVAMQTRRYTESLRDFADVFGDRLAVLARSNDVLTRADWHDAQLSDVIRTALVAFDGGPARIGIEGPSMTLDAGLTVTVSLALHELATNAVKYGALSVPSGRVEVSWAAGRTRGGSGMVDILWRESGGPEVQPPARRGFGSHLLEKGMPSNGAVQLDFHPEGLECRISLPLHGAANGR